MDANYKYIDETISRYPELGKIRGDIVSFCDALIKAYSNKGKLLICGNGGSCADADHITGELMKGFLKKRPLQDSLKTTLQSIDKEDGEKIAQKLQMPLRALNLYSLSALSSAFANDVDGDYVYAQLVLGLADKNDVFVGISTSGNSGSVHKAAVTARAMGMVLIGMTGDDGGKMNGLYDIIIKVPENVTYKIQELHIPVYHAVCLTVEDYFFKE